MKILITGGNGFVAPHLVDYIQSLSKRHKVYVLMHQDHSLKSEQYLDKGIVLIWGDLRDSVMVDRIIANFQFDKIFHLAAHSFVGVSFEDPTGTLTNNIISELNILEAVRKYSPGSIVHIACSSEQYGAVEKEELPINEGTEMVPQSPYAVSKITQEMLAIQYCSSYGLKTIITRAFNHEGAGRGRQFFLPTICRQIAEAEKYKGPCVIKVGNLNAIRDITHVKDMVKAYWLATEKCEYGVPYNVGTGRGWSMRDLLNMALAASDLEFKVITDKLRLRPSDVPVLICDPSLFIEATGWHPELSVDQVISDILNEWRQKV